MSNDNAEQTEYAEQQGRLIQIYRKDTWGSFGQHDNMFVIVIDPVKLTQKLIFDNSLGLEIDYRKNDSRKNVHREAYISVKELRKLEGKVLKFVTDYKSSSKRKITVEYYIVTDGKLLALSAETGMRDNKGFFDKVYLSGDKILKVRKDSIEVG